MHFSQIFAATLIACAMAAPLPHSLLEGLNARSLTSTIKDILSNAESNTSKTTGSNLVNNTVYDSTSTVNTNVDEVASDDDPILTMVARDSTSDVKDILYNGETDVTKTTGGDLVNGVLSDGTSSVTDNVKDVNGVAKKLLLVVA